jgi:hypothetical protein
LIKNIAQAREIENWSVLFHVLSTDWLKDKAAWSLLSVPPRNIVISEILSRRGHTHVLGLRSHKLEELLHLSLCIEEDRMAGVVSDIDMPMCRLELGSTGDQNDVKLSIADLSKGHGNQLKLTFLGIALKLKLLIFEDTYLA